MSMKAGLKIFLFFLFSISIAGATFPVGIGLQLDDILYNQNGSLVTLGNLTVTVWDSPIGGNLIYNESVQGAVKNGSVNIMLGELASLDLDYGVKYYYDMAINGEDIDFIDMSGGAQERQYWYSPVGQIQSGSVNMTSFGVYWNKTGGDLNPSLFENINMMLANIYNVTNVTANRFIGDGSLLNNITADSFNISADEWLYFNSPTNTKGLRYNLTGNKFEFVNATLYVPNIISANYVDAELGYFNYLQMGYKGYSTSNPFTIINSTGTQKLTIDFSGDLTFLDTADNQYITWDELGGQTAGIGVWNYGAYHSLELWSGFDAEDTIELYNPTNVWGNLTVIGGNATADYFIGDGSLLTNLPTGAQYWNRSGTTIFQANYGDDVTLQNGSVYLDQDYYIDWLGERLTYNSTSARFEFDADVCDVSTGNCLSNITNLPTAPITKVLYVDGNRVDSYTETGSEEKPYKTIQNAINNATTTTTILISPMTYIENITLKAGVNLIGNSEGMYSGIIINGKLSYSSGAGNVILSNIYVMNTVDHALEFTGTAAQKLRVYNSKFETNSGGLHHAFTHSNTNSGSEVTFANSVIQVLDSSGGAKAINTVITSAGSIGLEKTTVNVIDNISNIAVNLDGTVVYWHTMDSIRGRVVVSTGASATISIVGLYSSTQPVLTTNSAGITVLSACTLSSTANPIVTGAGAFAYSGVNYISTGKNFASTLNGGLGASVGALSSESAMNTIYNNATSGLNSTRVQTAIDELVSKLSVSYWNRTGTTLFTTTVGDNVNLTGNLAVDYDVFIKDNSVIYFTTAEDEYFTFTPVNLGSFALSHNLNIPVNDSYCWGDPINGHCITYNGSSVNFGDNVTAPYFIGDGRLLTNLPNQSQYWNRSGNVIQPSVFGDKAYLTGNVTMRSYNRFCLDESESVCFFYNSSYGYIDSGNNAWQYASLIVSQIRVHDGLGNSSDIYYNGTNFEFMNDVAVYGNLLADNVSAGNFFGNINWSYVQNAPSFLTSESDPLWSANYSLFNSSWSTTYNSTYDAKAGAGNCPAGQVVMNTTSGGVQCVTLVIIESDPLWSANYSLFNSSWSTTFNSTYNALIGEPLWSANYSLFNSSWSSTYNATYDALAGEPLWSNNYSLFNSSWSATYNATYNALIGEPLWSGNYSLFNSSWSTTYNSTYDSKAGTGNCPFGNAVQNTTTGGVQCVPITVTESDPLWSANYSLFNSSWSTTYNSTYNALIGEPLWSNNYSLFNSSWSTTYNSTYGGHINDASIHFLMTAIPHNVLLNLSWENSSHYINGNIPVNFNNNGAAKTLVYNTTTARFEFNNGVYSGGNVVVNGDAVPNINSTYSLGNSTNLWKNLYVNDTIYFNNQNISYNGSSFVASTSFFSPDFNTNETVSIREYQPYFRLTGGATTNSIVLETTGTRVIHNRFAQSGGSPQTGTGYHRFSTSNNFVSWSNASNVLHLYYRSNDATTVFTATLYVNGVADGNINGVTWSPALANTWYEYQRNASSSPSPGDFVNLEVSWTGNSAADNGDLADVQIYYKEYVL